MLGRHHLLLTVVTAAVILTPYLESFYGFVALLGVAIGSLIPDSDSPDAMIFHGRASGVDDWINKSFAPFFPLFGYTTKYLIYKPSITFYRILGLEVEEKHRGLMHSVLGTIASTILTAVYLSAVLWFLELFSYTLLIVFLTAYLFGYFMHLLEDSVTITGIKWLYPFSNAKLKGSLRTTTDKEDSRIPDIFSYILTALFGLSYGLVSQNFYVFAATVGVTLISWLVFLYILGLHLKR